ncbi:MAG: ATP-binding protein [Dissulfurispiraceae bacterium]
MKISIAYRMFLSILIATCMALLCMFLIMQWSINRGFLQYLTAMEQDRLEKMAANLEQSYAEHGSWDFLLNDPEQRIMSLIEKPDDNFTSRRLKEFDEKLFAPPSPPPWDGPHEPPPPPWDGLHQPPPPPLPGGPHQRRLRFIILDANRKPLVGNAAEAEDVKFRPLVHKGSTVGYIGLLSPKHFLNLPQFEFLKRQKLSLALAASGMVLIVVIFSLPLANRLVRPIKSIAAATRELASGKYAIRVSVSSSDELGQLARDFNTMALTLEKNEKARRQWVADISHELRTPLSVLRGEIEALMEGVRNTTPEAIGSLHAEALRLHRLVDDLYQLALSDLGTLTYRKEDIDLAEVLRDSIEPSLEEFTRKGITFISEISGEEEITVFGDRERLRQLFVNLLDNSLKYTDAGGNIAVRLTCSNNEAKIEFEDSLPGVTESELDKLFDRLYRVEASRNRESGGAGLGLAICRNIVDAHSGTISAHPAPLGGVLIRVALPITGECL